MKPKIEIFEWYSIELCRANPTVLFVFGDNLGRSGTAGQACIRYEPNSIGLATKLSPYRFCNDLFYDSYVSDIQRDFDRILEKSKLYDTLGFPKDGLGTGLAQMPTRCPKLFQFMCDQLLLCFGYENPNPLKP